MRHVKSQIEIAVLPEKVILAFTDKELLKGWWGVERSLIELKQGGIYTPAWGDIRAGYQICFKWDNQRL
jgi:uncharacterized protein YndB with AHSA1/START domain